MNRPSAIENFISAARDVCLTPVRKDLLKIGMTFLEEYRGMSGYAEPQMRIRTVVAVGAKQGSGPNPNTTSLAYDDGTIETFDDPRAPFVIVIAPRELMNIKGPAGDDTRSI